MRLQVIGRYTANLNIVMSISATTDQYIYTDTIQLIATTEFLFCVLLLAFVKPYIMSLGSISFDKEIIILISLAMFIVLFSPCSTSTSIR